MLTALYPTFVLVQHDLLNPEYNRSLAEIAIADAEAHRVVDADDPRNLGTPDNHFGHIRHNLLGAHRGNPAVEAWLAAVRSALAEYLLRAYGAELPNQITGIAEPFVQMPSRGASETVGIFTHTHPRADFVVTYYPEVVFDEAGAQQFREGALRFYDPSGRGHRLWRNRNPGVFSGSWFDVRPRTGTLVVFEGHVPHDSAPFDGVRRVCLPLQVSLRFPNSQTKVEIGDLHHGL